MTLIRAKKGWVQGFGVGPLGSPYPPEHNKVCIQTIHAVPVLAHVLPVRLRLLQFPYPVHDLVLSLPRHIRSGEDHLGAIGLPEAVRLHFVGDPPTKGDTLVRFQCLQTTAVMGGSVLRKLVDIIYTNATPIRCATYMDSFPNSHIEI